MNTDALKIALEAIRRKDRFEAEIEQMLTEKGFDITGILHYLRGRKFVDDNRVVASEVERLTRKRGLGPDRVREELSLRGAPEHLLNEALRDIESNKVSGATQNLINRFSARPDKGRAMRFLMSRGYDEETAETAFQAAFP